MRNLRLLTLVTLAATSLLCSPAGAQSTADFRVLPY